MIKGILIWEENKLNKHRWGSGSGKHDRLEDDARRIRIEEKLNKRRCR
jgi:hypothetical protein